LCTSTQEEWDFGDNAKLTAKDAKLGRQQLDEFCEETLKFLVEEQRTRFGHPLSIETYVRLDISIRKNPTTGKAGYFVNEVTCAPLADMFIQNHQFETHLLVARCCHQGFQDLLDYRTKLLE
jgi:hypothetical protein